jgi:hypothetical protein
LIQRTFASVRSSGKSIPADFGVFVCHQPVIFGTF